MASQITGVSIVCSTVCSSTCQRIHRSSVSLTSVEDGFPSQRVSIAENASIWWRHHTLDGAEPVANTVLDTNSKPFASSKFLHKLMLSNKFLSVDIIQNGWRNLAKYRSARRVDSSPPSAAYIRRWTVSALVQVMACRLGGAKPLSEPMMTYCPWDPKEHISMKFYLKFKYFHLKKMRLNMSSTKWRPFCPGGDELM